jgi:hypothetical protein
VPALLVAMRHASDFFCFINLGCLKLFRHFDHSIKGTRESLLITLDCLWRRVRTLPMLHLLNLLDLSGHEQRRTAHSDGLAKIQNTATLLA